MCVALGCCVLSRAVKAASSSLCSDTSAVCGKLDSTFCSCVRYCEIVNEGVVSNRLAVVMLTAALLLLVAVTVTTPESEKVTPFSPDFWRGARYLLQHL